MQQPANAPDATRSDAQRGRLVAALLASAWREVSSAPDLSDVELAEITPLLCRTGSAAMGWWRIRQSALASSPAGLQLHDAYRQFRLSALVHEREIKYIFSLLRNAGIEAVLIKGWVIARLYPDRGLRPYGDIDLCVRPDQFAKAEAALKCLDNIEGHYVDLHSGFAKLELATRSSARLLVFRVPTLVGSFSATKSPTEVGTLNAALWDKLFERSQLVSLGEDKIRVLGDEDHLRILCLHLLRSGAWRPLWLCDVAVALETLAANFDWERCLGSDPKIAEWVACTIGLAQQLLGAKGKELREKGEEQRAESKEQSAAPFALCSLPLARLPRWLGPAILRQWGRSLNPHAIEQALPALSAQMHKPGKFFAEVYSRWDQPVRATVALRGRFNNWPRWPYQLTELLLRSPEVPKQLARMVVREANKLNSRWQRHRIGLIEQPRGPRGVEFAAPGFCELARGNRDHPANR
jgi:hypothetical protein